MGFQGSLSSVNLGDLFQTIAMNRQSGTLVVTRGPDEIRRLWFDNGEIAISDGRNKDGRPQLLDVLVRRGQLGQRDATQLEERQKQTGQRLRELLAASGHLSLQDLDETSLWCLEEKVCEIFEWQQGDFSFIDGPPVPELSIAAVIEAGEIRLQTSQVVMEAMRRVDEWAQIRTVIPNPDELFVVDNEGRANLRKIESDPEMLKVLRYLDGRHGIEQIAEAVGISRFDAFAILANLVINQVARPRNPEETVSDALELRKQGETVRARELLENAAKRAAVPEVLRPLAELTLEAGDSPRAVELYLDLVQRAQDEGDLEQALADLDVVIGINPDDPDLALDRGEVLVDLGRGEDAASAFLAAAENFLETRDIKQAVDTCHRAKDLAPTAPGPHRILAKAYLLDNQADNALVEYKSLWHVLLTHHRPRRALEELRNILEADCKFPRIKDQVLQHASGSDAVKTGSAMRRLIYLLMLLVLVGAGFYGWRYYQDEIIAERVKGTLAEVQGSISSPTQDTDWASLLNQLKALYGQTRNADLIERINGQESNLNEAWTKAAKTALADFDAALQRVTVDASALPAAKAALAILEKRHAGAPSVQDEISQRRRKYDDAAGLVHALPGLEAARTRFVQKREWEAAVADLQEVLSHATMATDDKEEWTRLLTQWKANLNSARFHIDQAQLLATEGRLREAMPLLAKAAQFDEDVARDEARALLIATEQKVIADLKLAITTSIEQGDSTQTFTLLEELRSLVANAVSDPAKLALDEVRLPVMVSVNHHRTVLTIVDHTGARTEIGAPPGHSGPWQHRCEYPASKAITISASRPGFISDKMEVRADDKLLAVPIQLKRGALWLTRLEAVPTTDPVLFDDSQLMLCTDRNTIELINANLGTRRSIGFGEGVDSITQPPFAYRGQAFLSVSGQINAVDIPTRRKLWTWPEKDNLDTPSLGRMGLWVQESELIQGQLQIITGTAEDGGIRPPKVVILTVAQGELTEWPATQLNESVSAPPLVHQSVLYVPTGAALEAFDATSATRTESLSPLFTFKTRGEIRHRPLPATVFGRQCLLVTDASGAVVAIDADPLLTEAEQRSLAAWPLGGTPSGAPSLDTAAGEAFIGTDNGAVLGLNLGRKEQDKVLWRFPQDGRIGRVIGSPGIGRNGIYVTDDIGRLYCISRTGQELWQVDLGSNATTSPLVFRERIYVGTRGGDLLCFEEGDL